MKKNDLLLGIFVFIVSAVVYSQYGFEGYLFRDSANFMYSGQQFLNGVPPYKSLFDHNSPVAYLMPGVGTSIASFFNLDDIFTTRICYFILGCLTVAALYYLGTFLFESRQIGILTAFVFIGFWSFGRDVACGPRSKTIMVLFVVLSLLFTSQKKWFWAGFFGSLAFLTWQPTGVYAAIAIVLSMIQAENFSKLKKNLLSSVSGVVLPNVLVSIYFIYKDAWYEAIGGTFIFNIKYLDRDIKSYSQHLNNAFGFICDGFDNMIIPLMLGLFMILVIYVWRIKVNNKNIITFIKEDKFSALLLSFPAPVIWSFIDFQRAPDFYIFLPYIALGFAWLLHLIINNLMRIKKHGQILKTICFLLVCVTLISWSVISYRDKSDNELILQRKWAYQIKSRFEGNFRLWVIGRPEILVFLHLTNPTPYTFIRNGIDRWIVAHTPGGFKGWIKKIEDYDPAIIVFGPTEGDFKRKLKKWINRNYEKQRIGKWRYFVKKSIGNQNINNNNETNP